MKTAEQWRQAGGIQRSSELRQTDATRVGIGHALVDNCSSEEACSSIIEHAKHRRAPAYVITPNAQHIVLLEKDSRFRTIYDNADLLLADGISLLLAARFFRQTLKERVAGVDMFRILCEQAAREGLRVCLLGGKPNSAKLAAAALQRDYPQLKCETYCPPYGFDENEAGLQNVANMVRALRPDLLFVALGAPKQEYWIYDHGLELDVPVCVGVGGSFEMVGGVVSRAPLWVQRVGCEWLYRLYREPRRMWRRYLLGNAAFLAIVLRQGVRRALLHAVMQLAAGQCFAAELQEIALQEPGKAPAVLTALHGQNGVRR